MCTCICFVTWVAPCSTGEVHNGRYLFWKLRILFVVRIVTWYNKKNTAWDKLKSNRASKRLVCLSSHATSHAHAEKTANDVDWMKRLKQSYLPTVPTYVHTYVLHSANRSTNCRLRSVIHVLQYRTHEVVVVWESLLYILFVCCTSLRTYCM